VKTITFYAATNRSGNLLHIETDGCIVTIHVGLHNTEGQQITRVDVLPDGETRRDNQGNTWEIHPEDGNGVTRVVRRAPVRDVIAVCWDGNSKPVYRYTDEMHLLPDSSRTSVDYRTVKDDSRYDAAIAGERGENAPAKSHRGGTHG